MFDPAQAGYEGGGEEPVSPQIPGDGDVQGGAGSGRAPSHSWRVGGGLVCQYFNTGLLFPLQPLVERD